MNISQSLRSVSTKIGKKRKRKKRINMTGEPLGKINYDYSKLKMTSFCSVLIPKRCNLEAGLKPQPGWREIIFHELKEAVLKLECKSTIATSKEMREIMVEAGLKPPERVSRSSFPTS